MLKGSCPPQRERERKRDVQSVSLSFSAESLGGFLPPTNLAQMVPNAAARLPAKMWSKLMWREEERGGTTQCTYSN